MKFLLVHIAIMYVLSLPLYGVVVLVVNRVLPLTVVRSLYEANVEIVQDTASIPLLNLRVYLTDLYIVQQ